MSPLHYVNTTDLVKVAKLQTTLIWIVLLSILCIVFVMGMLITGTGNIIIILLLLGCFVLFQFVAYFQALRLSSAIDRGILLPTLLIFGFVIPILSLVMLVIISNQATRMLKVTGVKQGLMGVPRPEYPKLMHGNCPKCGYSRDGLDPLQICPECGRQPQVR